MSRKTTILSLAAFGALALAAVAIAQDAPQDGHGFDPAARFAARDVNHDGFIDKSEASDRMLKRFDTLDADHDGRISQDELKASWQARAAQDGGQHHHGHHHFGGDRLAKFDTDHDGRITLDEMMAQTKTHFDRLDANHDGVIDQSEMPKPGEHKNWRHGDGNSASGR